MYNTRLIAILMPLKLHSLEPFLKEDSYKKDECMSYPKQDTPLLHLWAY
jgi:hypothetical protein